MVFSSFLFLFLFLPVVLLINRFLPLKVSNVFLLLVSLLFYYAGEESLTIILIASISWNYLFGLLIEKKHRRGSVLSKTMLGLAVTGNLLLLIYYKYLGFIIGHLSFIHISPGSMFSSIILPIGISFFTFQGISYIVDVYRNTCNAEHNPIKLGLYISFFPQLIAGPIVKYNEIVVYLSKRSINTEKTIKGSFKFIRGLAKKIIFANSMAVLADQVFNMDYQTLSPPLAWMGLIAYALQIYFDFSGYSDMAIGLCLIMGFHIPENFKHPYVSTSIKEFWRRWHISLSTWFKQYLYIPLGGNRLGKYRTYMNLIIVFFITGLWHGASYNFIVWGLIHGAFLILERIFPNFFSRIPKVLLHAYTLFVVLLAWVFFRAETLPEALIFFQKLFLPNPSANLFPLIYLNGYTITLFVIAIVLATPFRLFLQQKLRQVWPNNTLHKASAYLIYLLVALYAILELSMTTHNPFIYFKF